MSLPELLKRAALVAGAALMGVVIKFCAPSTPVANHRLDNNTKLYTNEQHPGVSLNDNYECMNPDMN